MPGIDSVSEPKSDGKAARKPTQDKTRTSTNGREAENNWKRVIFSLYNFLLSAADGSTELPRGEKKKI